MGVNSQLGWGMIEKFSKPYVAALVCVFCFLYSKPVSAEDIDFAFDFSPSCARNNLYRHGPIKAFKSDERKWYKTEKIAGNCDWTHSGDRVFLYALQIIEGRKKHADLDDPINDRIVFSYGLIVGADYFEGGSGNAVDIETSRLLLFEASLRGNAMALDRYLDLEIVDGRLFDSQKAERAFDAILDFGPRNCVGLINASARVVHAPHVSVGNVIGLEDLKSKVVQKVRQDCGDLVEHFRQVFGEDPPSTYAFLFDEN